MKLVKLLAKELETWAITTVCYVQDPCGSVWPCKIKPNFDGCEWIGDEVIDQNDDAPSLTVSLSSDYASAVVTKSMWQAERDRQKGGEWKRHRGGKQPVADGTHCEYRYRDGTTLQGCNPELSNWSHYGATTDIMAFRIISQPQAEEVDTREYRGPFPCAPIGELENAIEFDIEFPSGVFKLEAQVDQIDGPIKWRDTVNELDAYIEEFTREREALINRLAEEGFALIPAMTPVMGVADVDMGDWRNWEIGDHLEIFDEKEGHEFKMGQIVKVTGFDGGDEDLPVKASSLNDDEWWFVNNLEAKFIRRP